MFAGQRREAAFHFPPDTANGDAKDSLATLDEVYDLIRAEARTGRTFLWYTTETEELSNCDRVYVFRNGQIVAALDRDELSEEKIIQSSFAEAAS